MTCEERQDLIFLYSAGELEPDEKEELRTHLAAGCPACAALAEAEAMLGQVAAALPPLAPPAEAREKLMATIAASQARENSRAQLQQSRMRIFSASILSAAAAVAITSAIFWYATQNARSFYRSPNLQTVSLKSDTQPGARGQVLWDRDSNRCKFVVINLAPPPAGKEYELWFIAPGKSPVRSRTFNVDENGKQSMIVEVPSDIGPIAAAAVTLERLGGSDTPTMPIQLVGQVPG